MKIHGLLIGVLFASLISFRVDATEVCAKYLGSKTTKQLTQEIENPSFSLLKANCSGKHSKSILNIGLNFTATAVSVAPRTDVIPTNQTGAVGEKQFVLMTYQNIRSFNKCTGRPDGILNTDAASFFNGNATDVRIEYDRFSRRWFVSAELPFGSVTPPRNLVIAVSSDSVIGNNTVWYFYLFTNAQIIPQLVPLGSGSIDYNQLAVDQNAIYDSMDTFDSLGNFLGTSTLVIEKKSLINGNPRVTVFPGIFPEPNQSLGEFTPPANNFDPHPKFGYLIHASNTSFPSGNIYTQLYLYRIVYPGSDNPVLVGPISINVPGYTEPANAPHQGNLYGANGFLQTGLFGGLMAPHVRDGQLFACHPIQVDSFGNANPNGDRVGVRWYQLDLTGDVTAGGHGEEEANTVPVLVQSGTLFDDTTTSPPLFYYIPSIMTNKNQTMVIEATVSGASAFTNVVAAGRLKKDPLGTLRKTILLTDNTTNTYNYGPLVNPLNGNIGQRWGDESSLTPDPVNDLDIWSVGEWASVQNGWGVQVTQLKAK